MRFTILLLPCLVLPFCQAAKLRGARIRNLALPPTYLSVPAFQMCLDEEDHGAWKSWCLPGNKPESCNATSWDSLSAMIDLPKCPNSELVGVLPPAYLSIPDFQNCLDEEDQGTWKSWCLPENKPESCNAASWDSLLALIDLPKCPEAGPVEPPAYLSISGFQNCLHKEDQGSFKSWCLPKNMPESCNGVAWDALSTDSNVRKCSAPGNYSGWFPILNLLDSAVTAAADYAVADLLNASPQYSFRSDLYNMSSDGGLDYMVIQGATQVVAGTNYRLLVRLAGKTNSNCVGSFAVEIYDNFGTFVVSKYGTEISCQDADSMNKFFTS